MRKSNVTSLLATSSLVVRVLAPNPKRPNATAVTASLCQMDRCKKQRNIPTEELYSAPGSPYDTRDSHTLSEESGLDFHPEGPTVRRCNTQGNTPSLLGRRVQTTIERRVPGKNTRIFTSTKATIFRCVYPPFKALKKISSEKRAWGV